MFRNRTSLIPSSTIWVAAGTTDVTAVPVITSVDLTEAILAVITAIVDIVTPSAGTFTAANATDLCTLASHGFKTGLKVQVSNSGGALPTGLSASTDYFVIFVSTSTFKLATSLANALAGTVIDITADGSGTNTVTPTTFADGRLRLQGSIDGGSNWVNVPYETKTITADSTQVWELDTIRYPEYRISPSLTAGYMTVNATALAKGA